MLEKYGISKETCTRLVRAGLISPTTVRNIEIVAMYEDEIERCDTKMQAKCRVASAHRISPKTVERIYARFEGTK